MPADLEFAEARTPTELADQLMQIVDVEPSSDGHIRAELTPNEWQMVIEALRARR